jgi:hypothetical protein
MSAVVDQLLADLEAETDRIWLEEPEEIKAMRLGVFTSGAGSYDQYFSNLVFINGDMRALSTWITPSVILNALDDESFSLEQCQRLFAWTNLVFVDFLAYCGFVKYAELAQRIIAAAEEIESKDEYRTVIEAWYRYANRMYLWVHQVFPWGLGTAFPKLSPDDLEFMAKAGEKTDVADYFERYGPGELPKLELPYDHAPEA